METFSVLHALCAGNSPITGEFPSQKPVTRSFGVLFDLRMNKPLSKQSWAWWFDTPSRSLWRYCNERKPLNSKIVNLLFSRNAIRSSFVVHDCMTNMLGGTKHTVSAMKARGALCFLSYITQVVANTEAYAVRMQQQNGWDCIQRWLIVA